MGFLNSSCSFTRFAIVDPVPPELWADIPQLLKKGAILDIDDLPELQADGWVCFDDYLDTEWVTAPPQKGGYLAFSLRLDIRRIPAGVVRKHLDKAIKQEKEDNARSGKKFISRERKKELKEQVVLKLRSRFLPVPGEFNVIWNTASNEVWFASTQTKVKELFTTKFLNTFNLHLRELTPSALALQMLGEEKADDINMLEPTQFSAED
ncbi:MAG: recombination-associated protein RdgC [Desulfovibrio sp.]|nr:recombination-associated protein RdgC [Desulfovibrio sp.]